MKTIVIFCLCPLLCLGCLSSRTPPADTANEEVHVAERELLIRLYKGSCYGQCPAYTLEIFSDGHVVLSPRRFLPVDSVMTSSWPVADILRAFDAAGLEDLEAEYMTPIADIPSYRISYRGKEIRWNTRKPVVLQNLVALLDSLTVNEGWLEPERAFRSEQVNRREEELIVQLKPGTDQGLWMDMYQDVGLYLIRRIVPEGTYLLVGYDGSVIQPDAMLDRVRKDSRVVLASFNKDLQQRD